MVCGYLGIYEGSNHSLLRENPAARVTDELEPCIGCMANTANITLVRDCQSALDGGEDACVNCYCRPMWCLDCMAKWSVVTSAANRLISEVVQSRRRPLLGPSPG